MCLKIVKAKGLGGHALFKGEINCKSSVIRGSSR